MYSDFKISTEDFNYNLPSERIAQYPLEKRDHSKLLIYKDSKLYNDIFFNIKNHLPSESLLVFNDTKVLNARIKFKKETGTSIEVFCLEPAEIHKDTQSAFQQKISCKWKCLVGNNKRWKSGHLKITNDNITLFAEKISCKGEIYIINFSWLPESYSFFDILNIFGSVPLPPYINRIAEKNDELRYQTVYAKNNGSVAAPTAGLHFTEDVFKNLILKGINIYYVTLHVGLGTFKPITVKNVTEHDMHEELFCVDKKLIELIIKKSNVKIIPVGTTSLRVLESLYWLGVKQNQKKENDFFIEQWEPYYTKENNLSVEEALSVLLNRMKEEGISKLTGKTKLMIIPGYDFKITSGIITNFHQPKSSLLFLVAAMLGSKWKEVYQYALKNNYRFLSYGDSCLFFKQQL